MTIGYYKIGSYDLCNRFWIFLSHDSFEWVKYLNLSCYSLITFHSSKPKNQSNQTIEPVSWTVELEYPFYPIWKQSFVWASSFQSNAWSSCTEWLIMENSCIKVHQDKNHRSLEYYESE